MTTVFNIGELPDEEQPDAESFEQLGPQLGGELRRFRRSGPAHRRGYFPATFIPAPESLLLRLAVQRRDARDDQAEARLVIPWFNQAFQQEGHSVCKDHWVAIRHLNRIVYAQWSDCGPFPHGSLPVRVRQREAAHEPQRRGGAGRFAGGSRCPRHERDQATCVRGSSWMLAKCRRDRGVNTATTIFLPTGLWAIRTPPGCRAVAAGRCSGAERAGTGKTAGFPPERNARRGTTVSRVLSARSCGIPGP